MNILVNAFGITDSGGLEVFDKLLTDACIDQSYWYHIICDKNPGVSNTIKKYSSKKNLHFTIIESKGILYRLFYENFIFKGIVNDKNIQLIYNFSGSRQFFINTPQLTKIQNLLFFSKKLDLTYIRTGLYLLWIKQIFIKRIILKFMLNKSNYLEVQSGHVKNNLSDFIDTNNKVFFVKSDIDVSKSTFKSPKKYDFSKKIKFLYIVGPHFEYVHKNFLDFTKAMLSLHRNGIDFEINITLSENQLNRSKIWDQSLNSVTNFFGYISDRSKLEDLFCDNTILISTSIIETLGLHVIEGIKNGVISIVPDETYSTEVYGKNIIKYELFNNDSLIKTIMDVIKNQVSPVLSILDIQEDIRNCEICKYDSVKEIFGIVENDFR